MLIFWNPVVTIGKPLISHSCPSGCDLHFDFHYFDCNQEYMNTTNCDGEYVDPQNRYLKLIVICFYFNEKTAMRINSYCSTLCWIRKTKFFKKETTRFKKHPFLKWSRSWLLFCFIIAERYNELWKWKVRHNQCPGAHGTGLSINRP